ncbi:MAG: hypothetical protein R3300_22700, partial [Candidatus Promineifilaceae bacterium]|nr:hypothetical protein [Candidatus Promineifilaceae bacterium]
MNANRPLFDEETWQSLPYYFGQLPEPIHLQIWGDQAATGAEREAVRLAQALSVQFETISFTALPRRVDYPYYPVIGIMGSRGDELLDPGVRIIGLPAGYQMTSFIAAVQSVSFRGMTSEAKTRIRLRSLNREVVFELLTTADEEATGVMAQRIFNMAVVSNHVKAY